MPLNLECSAGVRQLASSTPVLLGRTIEHMNIGE
jgi:hypothetical protein